MKRIDFGCKSRENPAGLTDQKVTWGGHLVVSSSRAQVRDAQGGCGLLPDTHAHLEAPEFGGDLENVLRRADEAGVAPILAVGSDAASSARSVELAGRYNSVYAAVGVHPHEADRFLEDMSAVRRLLAERDVVAVGEVGLDYYRQGTERDVQRKAFGAQLQFAAEADLPVSVHNRDADEDVLEMIVASKATAILHCFSGSREFASMAVSQGCYLSFAGNLTFKKAEALREVATEVPMERILVETDSPVLAPQPWRGRRNEPAHLVATVHTLAELKGMTVDALSDVLDVNARRVFRWAA